MIETNYEKLISYIFIFYCISSKQQINPNYNLQKLFNQRV